MDLISKNRIDMAKIARASSVFRFARAALLGISLFKGIEAKKAVTITVHAGARQTFEGFGAGTTNKIEYQRLRPETRAEISRMVWKDADFRALRLMSVIGEYSAEYFAGRYKLFIDEARAQQPDLKLLLTPDIEENLILTDPKTPAQLQQYARLYARQIHDLKEKYGIIIDVTGVCNEPNEETVRNGVNELRLKAWQIRELVKYFRAELDALGLQTVKIIAPETSNVDDVAYEMVDAIAADSQALAALWGWATHSYNMCMTRKMRDKVASFGKEYWQTEASSNDPEDFNDELQAAKAAGRFLGDVNLGVTRWFWFLAYAEFLPESNTPRLIGYDIATGEYRPFLKYYYIKQLSHAFNVGTVFRTATTNLSYEPDHMFDGKDRFRDMENDYGQKPPVCAAAGVNPDGTWSLAVVNQTGIPSFWHAAWYEPADTYDVTFDVEELRGADSLAFDVFRSSGSRRIERSGSEEIMRKGMVSVSAAPHELVTLWPRSKTMIAAVPAPVTQREPQPLIRIRHAASPAHSLFIITVDIPETFYSAEISLVVYDLRGKQVAVIARGRTGPGVHTVEWDGAGADGRLAQGAYSVRFDCGRTRQSARIVIPR